MPKRSPQGRLSGTFSHMEYIDLRSDTVTQPTAAMRAVMQGAAVGDDVLGDDPTVIELQNKLAKMLGKEAGLFVSSGTMSNAVAIRTHTNPGDEIVTESTSHIYVYEGGGYATLSGCSVALVPGKLGIMEPADVAKAIRKSDGSLGHYPNGSLVCVENTSNRGGGTCYPQETLDAIAKVAHDNDCQAHMDGARMFNAAVATGTDPARIVRDYDSISICLSKGLGCPVGSVGCGNNDFIQQARWWRKMVGGGMRQAGVIAAAGVVALETMVERLAVDHSNARKLAQGLAHIDGISIDPDSLPTNLVFFDIVDGDPAELALRLDGMGIKGGSSQRRWRFVTHYGLTSDDIDYTLHAVQTTFRDYAKA